MVPATRGWERRVFATSLCIGIVLRSAEECPRRQRCVCLPALRRTGAPTHKIAGNFLPETSCRKSHETKDSLWRSAPWDLRVLRVSVVSGVLGEGGPGSKRETVFTPSRQGPCRTRPLLKERNRRPWRALPFSAAQRPASEPATLRHCARRLLGRASKTSRCSWRRRAAARLRRLQVALRTALRARGTGRARHPRGARACARCARAARRLRPRASTW